MISIMHLLWIAPLCTTFGFLLCSLFAVKGISDNE